MTIRHSVGFAALVGGLGLLLLSAPSYSQQPPDKKKPPVEKKDKPPTKPVEKKPPAGDRPAAAAGGPLVRRLAARWKVTEQDVQRMLDELGQEISQDLAAGRASEVPGVGTFRAVRVHQHRETVNGKPVYVEGRNTVQLVPVGGLFAAANGPGARPAEEILPADYFYNDLPYGGGALDRTPPYTTGTARPSNPTNKPTQRIGGSRRPDRPER